ncbi:sugar phosphate nucleotidyltransferase [Paenibacillus cremeus]|uniref:Glucose-1-phosphate thymidylyltransferase n=1 Tax=Paenibacillus cremeus TaxID=2163881 RepID=A0A559KI85_9BACL|nr:sugar phosphate nucleotidyltransferase [Paenibacillus cremeus]TVY11819.1 spore coat protein [Paenibacillus cremeus]
MKGIILAGGTGTRLRPMTLIMNKHLLPVGKYPMIHYAISKMAAVGIEEIMLVTSKQSAGLFTEYIGDGRTWNVSVTYKTQETAGGIAQALGLTESFVKPSEKLMVLLGDNLFEDTLKEAVDAFRLQGQGAHVFLKKVDDPQRYGVPELLNGRIVRIVEKPKVAPTSFAVTGIYLYDGGVYDVIRSVRPSARGELEITDVNNAYAEQEKLSYNLLTGWWTDAGTHRSLLEAGIRLMERDGT